MHNTIFIRTNAAALEISKTASSIKHERVLRGEKDFSSLTFQLLILFKSSSRERLVCVGFFFQMKAKRELKGSLRFSQVCNFDNLR